MPVVEIDGATLGDGTPGPVARRLREIYLEESPQDRDLIRIPGPGAVPPCRAAPPEIPAAPAYSKGCSRGWNSASTAA